MALAIFDLDNTLLAGDSDYLWGLFLVERGIVNRESYESENARFYEEYKQGCLNIAEFLNFALAPLAAHAPEKLYAWREEFIQEKITPIVLPAARALLQRHQAAGDTLMIITATNSFVTAPIAELYGIKHLIATTPEMVGGRYTGHFAGTPCFQGGKVTRLDEWLEKHQRDLAGSWFYSDSHNDLPLLKKVTHAVAVDPDETLALEATQHGWSIISLRDAECPKHHLQRVDQHALSIH